MDAFKRGYMERYYKLERDIVKLAGELGIDLNSQWINTLDPPNRIKVYKQLKERKAKQGAKQIRLGKAKQ